VSRCRVCGFDTAVAKDMREQLFRLHCSGKVLLIDDRICPAGGETAEPEAIADTH
jgi:hypothetical protein